MTSPKNPLLRTRIAGLELRNPLVVASGIMGVSAASMGRMIRAGAGAVTAKSVSLKARSGHPNPTVVPLPYGMLNAVGLSNPGASAFVDEIHTYKAQQSAPLFASVFASTAEDFARCARIVAEAGADLVEVNVSCPNVASEFGEPLGADPMRCAEITAAVKAACGTTPVAIKLTPQCPSIGAVARACEAAGADAITAINTVGPGMHINVELARPMLSNGAGGLSGPAILPIAVRAVFQIRQAVSLPIIGTGGVADVDGALQMLMAGASAVGLGTAVATHGVEVFARIKQGLQSWLGEHGHASLETLVGLAHRRGEA